MAETTRNYFAADQKVLAVKRHLLDRVPVSQVCDELKIGVNTFYNWQKELFDNGHLAFGKAGRRNGRTEDVYQKKIATLETKIQRKDTVIAELMEEHVTLKKSLGEN